MVEEPHRDYYTSQAARLLHDFDSKAERFSKVLALHVQQPTLRPIIQQARQAFKHLIPEIPYIGGKGNRFTGDLIGCTMVLALYRALKGDGKSVEEIGKIVVEIEQDRVQSYPPTIAQPKYEMGALATTMLLERVQDRDMPPRRKLLDTRLFIRHSTAPPAR